MITQIFLLSAIYCLLSTQSFAQPVSARDLIEHAKEHDGKDVSFQGEVVGDVMIRKDFAWVNVNDGEIAIGIFCPNDYVKNITYKGGYNFIGDKVCVNGTFHRECQEHGGDLDIHAKDLIKIEDGRENIDNIGKIKGMTAFIGILTAILMFFIHLLIISRKPVVVLKRRA